MKKLFTFVLLLLALLVLASCEDGECEHINTTEITVSPNCTNEGYTTRTCDDCAYEYNFNYKEPSGHSIIKTETKPTCTAQGFVTYACSVCTYSYDADFVAPTGHVYTSSITDSTCTEGGYTTYTCSCGYSYKTKFTVPNGHHLTATVIAPTCTKEGYTTYSCECGYSYTSNMTEPTGHTFRYTVVRPSIGVSGYTSYTCKICRFSYDTDYVWYSNIFSGAEGDGEGILAYGVDISYWNEDVDFKKLKKAGIDFVIIRAGSIKQQPDRMFESHYKNAKAAGLDVGCYFYSYAETVSEVEEEVEILLELIDGKTFEYPIYFDMEENFQTHLSTERRMEMCHTFCSLLIDSGYFPGVYSNLKWLTNYFDAEELCAYFDVWYARYPLDSSNATKPIYFEDWDYELPEAPSYGIWQFTQSGRIDGIEGNVDINIAYKDYPALIKKYGFNGYSGY